MKSIDHHLHTFKDVIVQLQQLKDNLVITGSQVLIVHGLDIGRQCEDLDIVLYDPSQEQLDYIEFLDQSEKPEDGKAASTSSPTTVIDGKTVSSILKINRGGEQLNILVESGELPIDCLWYQSANYEDERHFGFIRVQSIARITLAKKSYTYESTTKGRYVRDKDVRDFQYIKNNNFNI